MKMPLEQLMADLKMFSLQAKRVLLKLETRNEGEGGRG